MTQEHPITPPPELVRKWNEEAATEPMADQRYIATQAARWGADTELEACCEWVSQFNYDDYSYGDRLRAARRHPKPPSLKEKASQIVDWLIEGGRVNDDDAIALRQLVESLPS